MASRMPWARAAARRRKGDGDDAAPKACIGEPAHDETHALLTPPAACPVPVSASLLVCSDHSFTPVLLFAPYSAPRLPSSSLAGFLAHGSHRHQSRLGSSQHQRARGNFNTTPQLSSSIPPHRIAARIAAGERP
jgi:hypothetical protein